MKTRTNILIFFTLSLGLLLGCSEPLAGPQLDTEALADQEHVAAKSASSRLADLSVRLVAEDTTPANGDSLYLSPILYNAGPDVATGVQVAIRSERGCATDRSNSGGNDGADIILWDIVGAHSSAADTTDSGNGGSSGNDGADILLWDIVGVQPGERLTLDLACLLDGSDPMVITAEVMKSDARDPDSTPGDGDPDQDDYASVTIYPEPPCSYCQR